MAVVMANNTFCFVFVFVFVFVVVFFFFFFVFFFSFFSFFFFLFSCCCSVFSCCSTVSFVTAGCLLPLPYPPVILLLLALPLLLPVLQKVTDEYS